MNCESSSEKHASPTQETIELINGEKWKVNEEMLPFITDGEKIVDQFLANKDTNYEQLASELKTKNSALIKSCTMQGRAHDELHKWLHPHLELVKELSKTRNPQQAEKLVKQLKTSYLNFHTFFH